MKSFLPPEHRPGLLHRPRLHQRSREPPHYGLQTGGQCKVCLRGRQRLRGEGHCVIIRGHQVREGEIRREERERG